MCIYTYIYIYTCKIDVYKHGGIKRFRVLPPQLERARTFGAKQALHAKKILGSPNYECELRSLYSCLPSPLHPSCRLAVCSLLTCRNPIHAHTRKIGAPWGGKIREAKYRVGRKETTFRSLSSPRSASNATRASRQTFLACSTLPVPSPPCLTRVMHAFPSQYTALRVWRTSALSVRL